MDKFKIEKLDQRCQNGAKKLLLRMFAIHRSNFLPAFDLFDLFSTFRITMILKLQTDGFHNFLSGFIIKLIERCKQIIYIRYTVLTEKIH